MMLATTPTLDWFNQTTVHPLGLVLLVVLGAATLLVPRRYALVPMLILVCFVGPAQRIVVATLDFNFLRLMVLAGWARVLLRGEMWGWRWRPLDTVVLAWAICATLLATFLHTTLAAFIMRLGLLYDAIGLYFLCRLLVRSFDDLRVFAQCAALVSLPVAALFLVEQTTGRNLFAIFGGVPEITIVRAGRLRCRGPFIHPILAGSFWAALMPLIGALWWYRGNSRVLSLLGLAGAAVVVVTCASATPLGGLLAGLIAATLFPIRRWFSQLRWGAVLGLIALQLVMVNPVWHLLARVQLVPQSTGWYRFKLIDEFIKHFDEWWLIGTESYSSWWTYGLDAITNEYILQGVEGGILTLGLFLAIIAVAFYAVGRTWREEVRRHLRLRRSTAPRTPSLRARRLRRSRESAGHVAMAWALGVALFIHCVVFIGVSNFGQTVLVWYLTLGFIGSLTPLRSRKRAVASRRPVHTAPPRKMIAIPGSTAPLAGA